MIAQTKSNEAAQFTMPVSFENFGWRDCEVLGVDIKHNGISLLSNSVHQPVAIDRNEPIDVSVLYTIKDIPYESRTVTLVFSGAHGDFSKKIELYPDKHSLSNAQIGGTFNVDDRINVPDHIPAGGYEMQMLLDSGEQKNIPGTIMLSTIRVVEINQKLSKPIEIPHQDFFYGWAGKNITKRRLWYGGMFLNWSGEECINYINNSSTQNFIFTVTAKIASRGLGNRIFGFFIDKQLIKKYELDNKDWLDFKIPVLVESGEHEFSIRFLNGGSYRSLIIEKVSIKNQ